MSMSTPVWEPIGIVEVKVDRMIANQMGVFKGFPAPTLCIQYHDVSKKDILDKIIKHLRKHADAVTIPGDQLKAWDANFVNKLDPDTLSELDYEAKHFQIKSLLDLTSQALSDRKNKTPEEVRITFNTNSEEEDDEELDAYVRDVVRVV